MAPRTLRAIGVIAAGSAVATATWIVARAAGVEPTVGRGDDVSPVTVPDVVLASVIAGFVAWAVRALLERRRGGWRWWPFIGSTALATSMIGPSWFADGASAMALMMMHFATGIVLIFGFARQGSDVPSYSDCGDDDAQAPSRAPDRLSPTGQR